MLKQIVGKGIRFQDGDDIVEGHSIVVSEDPLITVEPNNSGNTWFYNWDIEEGFSVDTPSLAKAIKGWYDEQE